MIPPLVLRYLEASGTSACTFPRPDLTIARFPSIIDPFCVCSNDARGPLHATDPMLATETDVLSECSCVNALYHQRELNFEFPFPNPSAAMRFRDRSIRVCHEAGGEVQIASWTKLSANPIQPLWLWDLNYNVQPEVQPHPAAAVPLCVLVYEGCFLDLHSLGLGVDHWMNSNLVAALSSPLSWVYNASLMQAV